MTNRAKVLTPVDTGRLRASIRPSLDLGSNRPSFRVSSNVEYAGYVQDGTRPHIIRPRRARALRFRVGGQTVFAQVVHHPGTRPRPYLDRALLDIARARGWEYRTIRR